MNKNTKTQKDEGVKSTQTTQTLRDMRSWFGAINQISNAFASALIIKPFRIFFPQKFLSTGLQNLMWLLRHPRGRLSSNVKQESSLSIWICPPLWLQTDPETLLCVLDPFSKAVARQASRQQADTKRCSMVAPIRGKECKKEAQGGRREDEIKRDTKK